MEKILAIMFILLGILFFVVGKDRLEMKWASGIEKIIGVTLIVFSVIEVFCGLAILIH